MDSQDKSQKYCSNCGSPLNDGIKFCPKCGASQYQGKESSGAFITSTDKSKTHTSYIAWGWVCAAVSLFIPIVGAGSITFGVLLIKDKRLSAAIPLIVCSSLFIILGLTGFGAGFFGAL